MPSKPRKRSDERAAEHKDLPVTGEVGGEGGSFADATYQRTEQEGFAGPGLEREEQAPNAGDAAGNETRRRPGDSGDPESAAPPADDIRKFPTD
jgi:hypothetical protein